MGRITSKFDKQKKQSLARQVNNARMFIDDTVQYEARWTLGLGQTSETRFPQRGDGLGVEGCVQACWFLVLVFGDFFLIEHLQSKQLHLSCTAALPMSLIH